MPSTYSPSLRLELIGSGEQSGTWGTTTNTNLGTLLEQSIVGVQAITMFDVNYTLTNYNGVSDEARKAVLVVSGTNTAARDIIAPLVAKTYTIKNNTTGGFAINIKAATGSSVSIPNGATSIVYCDGTNFNLAVNQTTIAAGTGISVATVGATNTVSIDSTVATLTGTQTLTNKTLTAPNLGTPTTLVGTNITGTAAGFSIGGNAATVTTNANLTGGVTSVGNAATVVTNANLTGGVTSVGNAATVVTNANLTGAVTSVGNASSLGSFTSANLATALTDETGSGAAVFDTSPTLTSPTLTSPVIAGTPSGVGTLTSGTAQSASGTSIDFTGIPSWVKRVTVMFSGVSTNGTSVKQVQLNGEVSGYLGTAAAIDGAPVASNYTTGAVIRSTTAANTINGLIVIQNLSGNIWVFSGMLGDGAGNQNYSLGFSKTTAATLTSIRLTTVNGTDTFDAGSINIMYE